MRYAPVEYPGLLDNIMETLESELGSVEYKPIVDEYREKFRSSTVLNERFASQPSQEMPKYLRIIATKGAHERWESVCEGDVGVLRWELVENYLWSTADSDVVMSGPSNVA